MPVYFDAVCSGDSDAGNGRRPSKVVTDVIAAEVIEIISYTCECCQVSMTQSRALA